MITKAREIFVENLKRIMKEKDKSQTDISRDLDIPFSTVSSWFTGKKYPRVDKMQELADYFDVSMKELTDEQPDVNEKIIKLNRITSDMSDEELNTLLEVVKVLFKEKFKV